MEEIRDLKDLTIHDVQPNIGRFLATGSINLGVFRAGVGRAEQEAARVVAPGLTPNP